MNPMTEVVLLILSCSLAIFLFIWLAFGRKVTSKAATLLMDICLIALCIAALICGLALRKEKYDSIRNETQKLQTDTDQGAKETDKGMTL